MSDGDIFRQSLPDLEGRIPPIRRFLARRAAEAGAG